jgi:outer membrane protein TolC
LSFTVVLISAKSQTHTSSPGLRDTTSAIEERLVQLAWQSPGIQKVAHQSKIDEYELKAAQNVWMNILAFHAGFNEYNVTKTASPTFVYPRYNLGITVPLGTLFSRTAVKSAKENIEIGKNDMELAKRNIREQVLTAYKQYMVYEQLIAMQSGLVNDVKTQLAQAEEKFRNGTISLEVYSNAQKANNGEMAALLDLRLQQDLKKLELEKLIGVKLETVLKK